MNVVVFATFVVQNPWRRVDRWHAGHIGGGG
jgi:hypothetical protein